MTTTVKNLLICGLAEYMRGMRDVEARQLAHELTLQVSESIIHGDQRSGGVALNPPCFPREVWNQLTVGVPWEAYGQAHGLRGQEVMVSSVKALFSAPAVLDHILNDRAQNNGLWGGSLLVALGQLLWGAKHELVIFSPYWRIDGVQSLMAAAGRSSYREVHIKIFTQPACRMSNKDREGVNAFINIMRQGKAEVKIYAPRLVDGAWPFIHAKLMIADRVRAYVGSANFTSSGLDHGVESGVLVEGEAAQSFAFWAEALEGQCAEWQE
jgi:phosphatidylserine/phosphatidylglycerophosphate/cardiolipin synthase-like enzyme